MASDGEGIIYGTRSGDEYAARKTTPGHYGLFWRSSATGQWNLLPGTEHYERRVNAEAALAVIAADNHYRDTGKRLSDTEAIEWK